jgi:tetratricopeptide (TPR) repeat protein
MKPVCVGFLVVLAAWLAASPAGGAPPPMAKKLNDDAQKALVAGQMALAATLVRGAWEISRDAQTLQQLAQINTMTGQLDEAMESYQLLLKMKPPKQVAELARSEIQRLKNMPPSFADELPPRVRATAEAKQAYTHGLKLAKSKDRKALNQATRYLRAALVLDPELPGTYRVLGAVYGKMKDPAKEQAFFQDYLRIRPDGRIAEAVRKRLKPTGVLATVTLTSSFPCEVWVNGRELHRKTPVKDLLLPSGKHIISFTNVDQYHLVRNMRVWLGKGQKTTVDLPIGVLEVKLKPWARVRAFGQDLGLWSTIGFPLDRTNRYELKLTAHDGSRSKNVAVTFRPGKTHTISRW